MDLAAIVAAASAMLKNVSDLTGKAMEFADPEKHAKNIEKLHQGVDESYKYMREIVQNDESLSTDEKLKRLKEIAEQETETKKRFGDILDNHQEKSMKIAKDVFAGILTAGLSLTIEGIKDAVKEKKQLPKETIDHVIVVESSEETEGVKQD